VFLRACWPYKLAVNSFLVSRKARRNHARKDARTRAIRLVGRKLAKFSFPRPTLAPSFNVRISNVAHASREHPKLTTVESIEERTSESVSAKKSAARIRVGEGKPIAATFRRAFLSPSFSFASFLENRVGNEKLIVLAAESNR